MPAVLAMGVAPGQLRHTRGNADRSGTVGAVEGYSGCRQPVEIGGPHKPVAITAGETHSMLVGLYEDDVGTFRHGLGSIACGCSAPALQTGPQQRHRSDEHTSELQ